MITPIFIWHKQDQIAIILLYIYDIIITGNDQNVISQKKQELHDQFKMTNLEDLKYFLGIEVDRTKEELKFLQHKYALELLSRANMVNCKPASTVMAVNKRLSKDNSHLLPNPQFYRS